MARSTAQDYLKRTAAAGLIWSVPEEIGDDAHEPQLFARVGVETGHRRRVEPDCAELYLARELKRPGVNLTILWEKYWYTNPEGAGYSRFCDLFRSFERRLTAMMRKHHATGITSVDYSGKW